MVEMVDDSPYLVKVAELQGDAAELLFHSLPDDGWDSCALVFREASPYGEFVRTCSTGGGQEQVIAPSNSLMKAMMALRDYNYDQLPHWQAPPTDESYVEDLQKYPRPVDQIPDWYPRY